MPNFFSSPRVLTITSPAIPQVAGSAALLPLKLSGHEAVNTLFEYTLILQSPDALQFAANDASNFPLHDMVGREITCAIALDGHGSFVAGLAGNLGAANLGAGVRELSGLITAARHLGTDTSGSWTAHAAKHDLNGPANAPVQLQVPPVMPLTEELWLSLATQSGSVQGMALAGEPYELLKQGAVIDKGVTDEWGRVLVKEHTNDTQAYQVRLADGLLVNLPVRASLSLAQQEQNKGKRNPLV